MQRKQIFFFNSIMINCFILKQFPNLKERIQNKQKTKLHRKKAAKKLFL